VIEELPSKESHPTLELCFGFSVFIYYIHDIHDSPCGGYRRRRRRDRLTQPSYGGLHPSGGEGDCADGLGQLKEQAAHV